MEVKGGGRQEGREEVVGGSLAMASPLRSMGIMMTMMTMTTMMMIVIPGSQTSGLQMEKLPPPSL